PTGAASMSDMTQPPPSPPAGWYPTPEGSRRFWDGSQWLDLPDPGATPQPNATLAAAETDPAHPNQKKMTRSLKIATVVSVVIVVVAGLLTWQMVNGALRDAEQKAMQEQVEQESVEAKREDSDKCSEQERQQVHHTLREKTVGE